MAHYKADVWLGSNSGLQSVDVNSNTFAGAQEIICTIYNVNKNQIRNLRETNDHFNFSETEEDANGTLGLVEFCVLIWVLVSFTPYFLMTTFGVGSGWLMTKITAGSTDKLLEPQNIKKYWATLIVALLCGGFGLVLGDHVKTEYFNDNSAVHNVSQ